VDVAAELTEHRPFLIGVARRILGSTDEAEDVVQEAFLRATRAEPHDIAEPRAWLTTVVGRLALDLLRSARARRESYVGPWLPEPVVGDPADRITLDEQVTLALGTVLETLSPAERVVYVLHEAFGVPLNEVADIVGRTPQACRQLASRARKHVQDRAPRFDADPAEQRRVVEAFRVGVESGDMEALARLLDDDVVGRSDSGGLVPGASRTPLHGRSKVLKGIKAGARGFAGFRTELRPVNGKPGIVGYLGDAVVAVVDLTVEAGLVTHLDIIVNPDKLRHVAGPE
jgi:RNA polymerase sigma-70 factor (ECF subfamily)